MTGASAVALTWQVEDNGCMKFYQKPNIKLTNTNTFEGIWTKNILSAAVLLVDFRTKMYFKVTHIQLFTYMIVAKSVERNIIANLNEYSYGTNKQ